MTVSPETLQIILIVIVTSLAVWALRNTKNPVEDNYYNDRHDQIQFDSSNHGCIWGLIALIISGCGVVYGFYWFFEALGK